MKAQVEMSTTIQIFVVTYEKLVKVESTPIKNGIVWNLRFW